MPAGIAASERPTLKHHLHQKRGPVGLCCSVCFEHKKAYLQQQATQPSQQAPVQSQLFLLSLSPPSACGTGPQQSWCLLQDLSRCQQRLAEAEAARLAHISQAQAALVSQEEHDRVLQQLQQFKMLEESNVGLR